MKMRALSFSNFSSSPSTLRSKIKIARFYNASPITPSRFLSISSTRGASLFQPSLLSVASKTMSSSSQCSVSRETTSTERGEASRDFQCLDGIRTLAESGRFKAWFLDQYGVLHDGKKPYPGAISTLTSLAEFFSHPERADLIFSEIYPEHLCDNLLADVALVVEKLAATGAKMVIISNSSRRAVVTDDKLKSLGFDPSLFLGAITSGELAHQFLLRRDDPWFAALGRRCIHMTWNDRGAISLEGLGLEVVSGVDDAEFILAHGTEALGLPSGGSKPMDLEGLEQILELCAKRTEPIPMVVANPDYVTVEARDLRVMPGTLGAKYEKLGGDVRWMGKPDKVIYESAIRLTGINLKECITVGDSLHHDIKGSNRAGIQSAFITGGIHADELGLGSFGETTRPDAVHSLCTKFDAYPNFVLPSFTW